MQKTIRCILLFFSIFLFGGIEVTNAQPSVFGWDNLGSGLNGDVHALIIYNGNLIAGGEFTGSGSDSVKHIARWTGNAWVQLGNGLDGEVSTLSIYNGNLIAAGDFQHSGS